MAWGHNKKYSAVSAEGRVIINRSVTKQLCNSADRSAREDTRTVLSLVCGPVLGALLFMYTYCSKIPPPLHPRPYGKLPSQQLWMLSAAFYSEDECQSAVWGRWWLAGPEDTWQVGRQLRDAAVTNNSLLEEKKLHHHLTFNKTSPDWNRCRVQYSSEMFFQSRSPLTVTDVWRWRKPHGTCSLITLCLVIYILPWSYRIIMKRLLKSTKKKEEEKKNCSWKCCYLYFSPACNFLSRSW